MRLYDKDEHGIILDFEDHIRKEYMNNLSTNERFIKIYSALEQQGRINFVSGKLDNKHKHKLISLGFHEVEDHAFTGAAMNSDKCIVTEDSDYGKGSNKKANSPEKQVVLKYMTDEMGMCVYDSIQARKAF